MTVSERRAAVLGKPVRHSLSPVLHRCAYRELDLPWRYDAVECDVADLPVVLASRSDWAGLSCTMPLKQVALDVATDVTARARTVGAANTLVPVPGGWLADNTDVTGLVAALSESETRVNTATLLGAGGTARAALGALHTLGVRDVAVLVRDRERARAALAPVAAALPITLHFASLQEPPAAAMDAELVLSTLPRGAADIVAGHRWQPGQTVFDVVYDGWPSALARAATTGGATVISGASLLLLQAVGQVELMTGRTAPVDAMRAALRAVLPDAGL